MYWCEPLEYLFWHGVPCIDAQVYADLAESRQWSPVYVDWTEEEYSGDGLRSIKYAWAVGNGACDGATTDAHGDGEGDGRGIDLWDRDSRYATCSSADGASSALPSNPPCMGAGAGDGEYPYEGPPRDERIILEP
ncbi:hypothetical protein EBT31_11295 [bacterium]|nr:hypothetical protein [bacterium]